MFRSIVRRGISSARNYASFPYPPNYDWEKEQGRVRIPSEHNFAVHGDPLPNGMIYSALNPKFLAVSLSETLELYRLVDTISHDNPMHRNFEQLLVYTPERRAKQALAAYISAMVCIQDDDHFVDVCERLLPDVLREFSKKQIVLMQEAEKSRVRARHLINQYYYAFNPANTLHMQLREIESAANGHDQTQLYKSMTVWLQSMLYKQNIYPHIDTAVVNVISRHLIYRSQSNIPLNLKESKELYALPSKLPTMRHNHVVVGGAATGKSVTTAQVDMRYRRDTGRLGLRGMAVCMVDRVRLLIKPDDIVLSACNPNLNRSLLQQSWGSLSHMEAGLIQLFAMNIVSRRLAGFGRAPDIYMETLFPDEAALNTVTDKGAKLFLYFTNYNPATAVDGSIKRGQATGRFVPIDIVLGSQTRATNSLRNLVTNLCKHKLNKNVIIEHHDTESMVHKDCDSVRRIGLIVVEKGKYYIYDIAKTMNLMRAAHLNNAAMNRNQLFANAQNITPEALSQQFMDAYGELDLVFMHHDTMVTTLHLDDHRYSGLTYATYSKDTGFVIVDDEMLAHARNNCPYSRVLLDKLYAESLRLSTSSVMD